MMKNLKSAPTFNWRTAILASGFVGWSAAMILLGSIAPDFSFSPAKAATASSLVRLDRDRLSGNNLGEFAPYHPESGNLIA